MPETVRICLIPGCQSPIKARGLCQTHYMRERRNGTTEQTRPKDWGARDKHPLYERWKSMRRLKGAKAVDAWDDFWQFVSDIGQPPEVGHMLYRLDSNKPWGPDNFEWRERLIVSGQQTRNQKAAYMRQYFQRSPHVLKRAYLKRNYGITLERYNELHDEQDGKCAICDGAETTIHSKTGQPMLLAVDHDHSTGEIRGLLCQRCNRGLGLLRDSPDLLRRAADYLEKHSLSPSGTPD